MKAFEEMLRQKIEAGELTLDERLLSVEQICKSLRITPREVRAVIKKLIKERILVSFGGKGTYVLRARKFRPAEKTIGVITTGIGTSPVQKVLRGIEAVLDANGYDFICKDPGNSQSREEKLIKALGASGVSGFIIEPSESQIMCRHMRLYEELDKRGIPYIFIRTTYPQMSDKERVIVDDSKGGYMITRHMIATVGDNIVGVFRADSKRGLERHRGYVKALQEAGIPYRPELVVWYHLEERIKKPTLALEEILRSYQCDGIICYDDAMATNIMYYLFSNGYSIPEDIAVAGYGNTAIAMAGELGLTTIAQPDELLGNMAAEFLLEKLCGETESKTERVLSPELVIRGSTVGSGI